MTLIFIMISFTLVCRLFEKSLVIQTYDHQKVFENGVWVFAEWQISDLN